MSNIVPTQQAPQSLPSVATPGAVVVDDTRMSMPARSGIVEKVTTELRDVQTRYFDNLPADITIGEADAPMISDFAYAMSQAGASANVVHAAIRWYTRDFAQKTKAADDANRQQNDQRLRQMWGDDYARNAATCHALIDSAGDDIGNLVFNARLADGSWLGDSPEVLTWLLGLARMKVQQYTPSNGGNRQSRESELESLERMMSDKQSRYWKGRESEQLQERYRELIDSQSEGQT